MAGTKASSKKAKQEDQSVFFEHLFRGLWARMVPILGVTNTNQLLNQALQETISHYPVLEHVRVREGRVALGTLAEDHQMDEKTKEALWAYLERLLVLAGRLSGAVVSRKLLDYIESQEKAGAFGGLLYRTGLEF